MTMTVTRSFGGLLVVAALLATCSCGTDAGLSVDGGSESSNLSDSVSQGTAPYLILNLASGTTVTRAAIADLGSNSEYRTTSMVFRRVKGGSGEHWLGVFEITQAQWQTIAGTTPWTGVSTTIVGNTAVGNSLPAFNLSYDAIITGLSSYRSVHGTRLGIPDDNTWTDACAAGSSTTWSWGEVHDRATLATYAAVWETQGNTVGPRAVGGRSANANGFYDMHGNVWEWTSPGIRIRGGSWHDPAILARTTLLPDPLVSDVSKDTTNALIGVRLTIQP